MAIERVGPVVVGVDGTPTSMAAVDLAAAAAVVRVTPLLVVHAYSEQSGPRDDRMLALRRLLEVAAARARAEHPALSVATDLVCGDPVDVLARESRRGSLLVVGHASAVRSGASVASGVAARADVPVIVFRQLDTRAPAAPRPVLVGIRAIAGSDAVVAFTFAEAALRGAPLLALHAWSEPADSYPFGMGPDGHRGGQAHDDADRLLAEALAVWADKYPEVPVRRAVRHCLDVGVALTAASRSAQLVVIGGPDHAGSTVLPVLLHRAGCPVGVVPAL